MGHAFKAVGWNPQKRRYDLVVAGSVVVYLALFLGIGFSLFPDATVETLLLRGLSSAAFVLLHVILAIGPLHRLFPATAPLLYNRRHLGIAMFTLALAHAILATIQFHVLGVNNPLVSILSDGGIPGAGEVPFQLVAAIKNKRISAPRPNSWKGTSPVPGMPPSDRMDTNGLFTPSTWNWIVARIACARASVNMAMPKCRRL